MGSEDLQPHPLVEEMRSTKVTNFTATGSGQGRAGVQRDVPALRVQL